MEEVAAFHGAPGSRHQCLLPLPEGAHRRRWLPWVSPWRAWRSVAPSSAPRSRLPTSRPGGPGTFPNIPISSQYHPNIIQYPKHSKHSPTFKAATGQPSIYSTGPQFLLWKPQHFAVFRMWSSGQCHLGEDAVRSIVHGGTLQGVWFFWFCHDPSLG